MIDPKIKDYLRRIQLAINGFKRREYVSTWMIAEKRKWRIT